MSRRAVVVTVAVVGSAAAFVGWVAWLVGRDALPREWHER